MDLDSRALAAFRTSWEFSEAYVAEDAVLTEARARAEEVGCAPILPGGGAALRLLAALLDARHVVEIGTGTGVSGVWLLRGMNPEGVLTSVDVEAEHQRHAREAFAAEGVAPSRTRLITGRALEVLPRLADASYDLVLADGAKDEYPDYVEQAARLLRPGGALSRLQRIFSCPPASNYRIFSRASKNGLSSRPCLPCATKNRPSTSSRTR